MGKSMTFHKNRRPLNEQDARQLEARLNKELEERQRDWVEHQKDDITAAATELAGCLYMVAVHNVFGFGNKRLMAINDEIERMSDEMAAGRLTWWDVRDEASRLGFVPANEKNLLEVRR